MTGVAPTVLFIRNDPTAPEALLGEVFTEFGFDSDVFDAVPADRVGDPTAPADFPDPARYDVIVPLGSRWSVYDDRLAWVTGEIAMVRAAVRSGVGVLGVCFGGQLLAAALGGSVTRAARPEIGWHDVASSQPRLVPPGPWFQWHFDRFTVPPGARLVASNACAPQAFVSGPAMGLQFHPELDAALLERWIEADAGDLAGAGLDPGALRSRTAAEAGGAARRLRGLVGAFLGLSGRGPR